MKINCTNPRHKDETASMELYDDAGYCFACGWIDRDVQDKSVKRKEPTNVSKELERISRFPIQRIRGLYFPSDSYGYFQVWPSNNYYKKRLFKPIGKTRYLAPTGVKPPLYVHEQCPHMLVLVEGEINARSAFAAGITKSTIASPGSATNLLNYLTEYSTYAIVTIVVDKDRAGVINGLKLKDELFKRGKRVVLHALEEDFNETLQKEGFEGLKQKAKDLGL